MAEYPQPKPKTANEKMLNDFIKQYTTLIKSQELTFSQAVDEIVTTIESNPTISDNMPTKSQIEEMLTEKQKDQSMFSKLVDTLKSKDQSPSSKTMDDLKDYSKEQVDQIAGTNEGIKAMGVGFKMFQNDGFEELKDYSKEQVDQIAGTNEGVKAMGIGFKMFQGEGFDDAKDYGKSQYDQVVADNAAVEIGQTLFSTFGGGLSDLFGNKGEDEFDMESTDQMLSDINETMSDGQDRTLDMMSNQEDTNASMLSDINETLGGIALTDESSDQMLSDMNESLGNIDGTINDQYELEYEQYLKDMRQRSKKEKGGMGWLQKLLVGFAIGAFIGGYVRSVLIPFELALKVLKLKIIDFGVMFSKMGTLIKKSWEWWKYSSSIGSKVADMVAKLMKPLKGLFGGFGKLNDTVKNLRASFKSSSLARFVKNITSFFDNTIKSIRKMGTTGKVFGRVVDDIFGLFKNIGKEVSSAKGKFSAISVIIKKFRSNLDIIIKGWATSLNIVSKGTGSFKFLAKGLSLFFKYFDVLKLAISPLFSALKVGLGAGFKFLGWPLTFIFGIIDFIKGFKKSVETTLLGKMKDGLKQVVIGFIKMPVKLFGWLLDKVLGWFGVEGADSANKILGFVDFIMESFFDFFVGWFTGIWSITKAIWTTLYDSILWYYNAITTTFTNLFEMILFLPKKLAGWFMDAFNTFKDGGWKEGMNFLWESLINLPTALMETALEWKDLLIDKFMSLITYIADIPSMIIQYMKDKIKSIIPGGETAGKAIEGAKNIGKSVVSFFTGKKEEEKKEPLRPSAEDIMLFKKKYGGLAPGEEDDKDWNDVAGASLGGLFKTKGLAFVHPNELIGPADEIIPQIINEATSAPIGEMSNDIFGSKVQSQRDKASSSKRIEQMLNNTNTTMINNIKQSSKNDQAGRAGDNATNISMGSRQVIQPPADIEALGLLFFNKTWGIA